MEARLVGAAQSLVTTTFAIRHAINCLEEAGYPNAANGLQRALKHVECLHAENDGLCRTLNGAHELLSVVTDDLKEWRTKNLARSE